MYLWGRGTWTTKHAYQLRRAAAVVADGYHVAERALLILPDRLEYVDEVVCGAAAGEDDDAFRGVHGVARVEDTAKCARYRGAMT